VIKRGDRSAGGNNAEITGICEVGGARGKYKKHMQKTSAAILTAIIVVSATGAVIAETDPIAMRQSLMKENNNNAIAIVRMMRGLAPFDAAKIDAAFAQWADTAQKLPGLFPETSKTGQKTRAASKVWVTKVDFDLKAAAFGKAVAENRNKAKTSLDGLRAAIPAVANACDACHKDYRLGRE
jgi:cytochrome c556